MSRRGRKRSLEDTGKSWSRRVCSSFQRINNWTFYIYCQSERLWSLMDKPAENQRWPQTCWIPSSDGLNLWSDPESFSPFRGYHRDCYQRSTNYLTCLIPQGPTLEDAPPARQNRHDSATKTAAFQTRLRFLQLWGKEESNETNRGKLRRTVQVWKREKACLVLRQNLCSPISRRRTPELCCTICVLRTRGMQQPGWKHLMQIYSLSCFTMIIDLQTY